jgi:hypothetical protein
VKLGAERTVHRRREDRQQHSLEHRWHVADEIERRRYVDGRTIADDRYACASGRMDRRDRDNRVRVDPCRGGRLLRAKVRCVHARREITFDRDLGSAGRGTTDGRDRLSDYGKRGDEQQRQSDQVHQFSFAA